MPAILHHDLAEEAALMERFVQSYRRRFAAAIASLNRGPAPAVGVAESQCLRLCVEAMDMMLSNQDRLARALRNLASPTTVRPAA